MRKFLLFTTIFLMEKAFAELLIAERYHLAVTDAAIVKAEGKTDQLWPITTDNSHLVWNEDKTKLVVVLWMNYVDYNRYVKYFTKTPDYRRFKFWVTAAPQVKNFCKQLTQLSDVDLDLRLKQYLGLPPNFNFDVFIELWVSPESLFRPCIDPEITDNKCEDIIPDNFTDTDHGKFYQQLYFDNFRYPDRYPWTGLGYTYDWGNENTKVGASEFIIKSNAHYKIIGKPLSTRHYCSE